MWGFVKEAAEHSMVSDIKWDLPTFDTVLLHSKWSNLRRKYLSKIPTDLKEGQNPNRHKRGPKA